MNVRFVVRGFALALPVALLLLCAGLYLQSPLSRAPEPTPLPPSITAPRGQIPAAPVGLREYARYRGGEYRPVGSGFLLGVTGGEIVAVTPAHSVSLGERQHPLERIALGVDGQPGFVTEADTLWGLPGRSLTPTDLSRDYLLLQVDGPVEPQFVLLPDARGGPQPGERVLLFSGVAGRDGEPRVLAGTVQSADEKAVWVLMDDLFNPSQMSGSPLISQHTGQVVGMVLALSPRRARLLIGAHPIGSLVILAETASEFPRLGE